MTAVIQREVFQPVQQGKSAASGNRDQENGLDELTDRQSVIVKLLYHQGQGDDPETEPETMQSLAHKTGVSDSTVKRELKNLVSKGWIVRIGSDRGGWWKVIKKL